MHTLRTRSRRIISKTFRSEPSRDRHYGRTEMDSHADTFVAGRNCTVMTYTERVCDVMPYSDQYEPRTGIPIATVATGYTSQTGKSCIIIINEAIVMHDLEHSLLNPNQFRHFGTVVQDNPYDPHQPMEISTPERNLVVALKSSGTTIYFDTWSPTAQDLEQLPHYTVTGSEPWEPHEIVYPSMTRDEAEDLETIATTHTLHHRSVFDLHSMNRRWIASADRIIVPGPLTEAALRPPKSFLSTGRHSNTTPEDLSEVWGISTEQAQLTLRATTQNHVRSAIMPLSRRYRVDRMFEPKRIHCDMATDTMDGRISSHSGERYCQVYGNKNMFCEAYPIAKKSDCEDTLKKFVADYGAPDLMITDGSKEQTAPGSKFQATLRRYKIPTQVSGPYRPNQNPAETVIRELRKRWYRTIFRTNCPRSLWNYGLPHIAKIMQLTASNAAGLDGRTPLEIITGDTPDISEYLDFGFYDRVWFKENAGLEVPKLARFLGVAHRVGMLMSFWVLPESGIPVAATTVSRIPQLEKELEANQTRFQQYDEKIAAKFKEERLQAVGGKPNLEDWSDLLEEDEDFAKEFATLYNNSDVPEADDQFSPDSFDMYINMELALDRGTDEPQLAKVTKRLRDKDGKPIGTANDNPILDTRMYEVEYLDGHKVALSANVIAENMFAQVDELGRRHQLLDTILDTRTDGSELKGEEAFVLSQNGVRRRRETTKGWEVLVQWRDGSSTWNSLKDIKDSFPVDMAEFAITELKKRSQWTRQKAGEDQCKSIASSMLATRLTKRHDGLRVESYYS